MRLHRLALALALGVLGAFALFACSDGGDPVRETDDHLVSAIQDRDADDVGKVLADDFRTDDGTDKAGALALARRDLGVYRSLVITLTDVKIVRETGVAGVTFRAHMVGVPRSLGGLGDMIPGNGTYDVDLRLAERDGKWLITKAAWAEPGPG